MTAIWAHRGANLDLPENTMPAFLKAIELGVDGIELDVQRSLDGVIVVCHDETLERTSDGRGPLNQFTFEQLSQLDFSAGKAFQDSPWFHTRVHIPTLRSVLEVLAGTDITLNIELKNSIEPYKGMEAEVDQLVGEFGLADQVIYSSFKHKSMKRMEKVGSTCRRALLFGRMALHPVKKVQEYTSDGIHPNVRQPLLADLVRKCHRHGIAVRPWTVDAESDIRTCLELGVDAIITNQPQLAMNLRSQLAR